MTEIKMVLEDGIKNIGYFDDLLEEHWDEVAKNKVLMVLKPDYNKYAVAALTDKLMNITVYDGDKIVGYSVNLIDTHLHYEDLKVCTNDVFFLKKEYRKGSLGLRLMAKTEEEAKKLGAQLMLWHTKEGSSMDLILRKKKQYSIQDIVHSTPL